MTEKQESYFQRFQQIEWASILLLTQFFFAQKKPLMCSGANLAYRKSAFLKVAGYDQNRSHLSGDDEFLLKKISAEFGGASCVYMPFSPNLVMTQPQPDLAALLSQRVRWAGKWRAHRELTHASSAVVSVAIQLVWFGSLLLLGFGLPGILAFSAVWIGKIWAERMTLGKVLQDLGMEHSIIDFINTSLLHPLYGSLVATGAWRGKFRWKGRAN
jgi:cellulose synthase/poly-beta-1,6-N-acetylglucosamine synthase-like glycosyltransferase